MAATPCSRTSTPALTLRATIKAIVLAIDPPLTSVPLAEAGKPIISLHPVDDLLVHRGGGVIPATKVGALDRGQKVSQSSGEVARPHVPGPETRMDVAHWVGHQRFGNFAVDLRQWRGRTGQVSLERAPDLTGHVPPDRTIANVAQIGDRVVDGAVCDGLRIGPVFGVERFFRGFARLGEVGFASPESQTAAN